MQLQEAVHRKLDCHAELDFQIKYLDKDKDSTLVRYLFPLLLPLWVLPGM